MTFHAVQHPGQGKIRQTGAAGNRIVTSGAIYAELLLDLEMRDMGELHIDILSGHRDRGDHAAGLREAGILDFLGRMATTASGRIERRGQGGLHARLGVTSGALGMPGERGKDALLVELVAERAVRSEPRSRINARLFIDVLVVRKLKQDSARRFVARKRQQVRGAGRRESAVTLRAYDLLDILLKVVGMARHALIVPRPLQYHRTFFDGRVAEAAFQPAQLFGVKGMNEELFGAAGGLVARRGGRR